MVNEKVIKIRLLGVSKMTTIEPHAYEFVATGLVRELLVGEEVYLSYEKKAAQERDGRIPAYVYRVTDDLPINLEMIRRGYASPAKTNFRESGAFQLAEENARLNKLGLWSEKNVEKGTLSFESRKREIQADREKTADLLRRRRRVLAAKAKIAREERAARDKEDRERDRDK
jgi:endonuclease YncB( thermonuclease family)